MNSLNSHCKPFENLVARELGDVAIWEDGRYISPKIQRYYLIWEAAQADARSASVSLPVVEMKTDLGLVLRSRMILCAVCGNKRCPHIDPQFMCTGSNEPGQVGVPFPEADEGGSSEVEAAPLSADWKVSQAIRDVLLETQGEYPTELDIDAMATQFVAHYASSGVKVKDWETMFMSWALKSRMVRKKADLLRPAAQEEALAEFTHYFTKNYPGPDTIIQDPNWHAPKLFKAALHAIDIARKVHAE